jgi:dolichyl-phosphate-mannose--protein O-mannosyl transferase
VLRFFSPLFPDLYAHPTDHFDLSNCVVHTPVDPQGDAGTLCGLAYPFNRGYRVNPSDPNSELSPPHGEVFDEIYFADFAHDDLKGVYYFDPEPPLSKLIIASGEWAYGWWRQTFEGAKGDPADLGFVPSGWRLMPALFGTLCVPLMYLLAFSLKPSRWFAAAAAMLVCFDGMFFIQSRIGMIDIFPIFFILLSYFVFQLHLASRTEAASLVTLALTGVVLGVAIAAKWIALAAWASILFILFVRVMRRALDLRIRTATGEWRWGRGEPDIGPALPAAANPAAYATVLLVAFFLAPAAIYVASWWPDFFQHGYFKSLGDMWRYNVQAYVYHATLKATHPYGSPWYSWPFLIRPVAYYYESVGLGVDANNGQPLVAGMVNLGNPWIWWTSLPCLVVMPYWAIRYKSYPAALITIGFVTQYLPWSQISRVIFLYHMFGGLPFMLLALALVLSTWAESDFAIGDNPIPTWISGRWILGAHLAIAVLFFVYFYPVWTAIPIGQAQYLDPFPIGRMWLRSWI